MQVKAARIKDERIKEELIKAAQQKAAPHIRAKTSAKGVMIRVAAALLPALAAGIWRFGERALWVTLTCVLCALGAEGLVGRATHRRANVADGSAAVTGLLLAMTLPPSVPYWQAALGALFAIGVVKALGGGLGQNSFNPALAARALLMLIHPLGMTRYAASGADALSSATPLHRMAMPALPQQSLTDMLLGGRMGSIGEVSALALLLGGGYLLWRGVISPRIPLAYLGSVAALSLAFPRADPPALWMLYSLLSGGVLLGALFMATDYASSPATPRGQLLYGAGCGALTVFFRCNGLFPEGVTYAVLIMNACAWAIDRHSAPRRFGTAGRGGLLCIEHRHAPRL